MPKIGDHSKNSRNIDQWWVICQECGGGFWSQKYVICFRCADTPGHKQLDGKGNIYIRVAENDPYYEMTLNRWGYFSKGWMRESRYVVAQQLGRCLERHEVVYRRNFDKTDNSPENLYIVARNPESYEGRGDAWEPEEI